jgi:hypothetical protein
MENKLCANPQKYLYVIVLLCLSYTDVSTCFSFNKVVIWGHKLHSHTHSYVHNAFYRAFLRLGYKTYWFDNNDNVNGFDFSNSLFLTEGQVDQNIPLRADCKYIIHNCNEAKYQSLLQKGNCIKLQVYTDTVLNKPNCQKKDQCIYYDLKEKCVYMPWATDLFPEEIESLKKNIPTKNNAIYWIGSFGGGEFGNDTEINPFIRACNENHISFHSKHFLSVNDNIQLIRRSYMAPTIVGTWQKEVGYIPCRIFKNISYGQLGITNSKQVYELFEKKIVYNPNTYQLFYDAQKRLQTLTQAELFELMDVVKTKHTYLNRIQTLLDFLTLTEATYGKH